MPIGNGRAGAWRRLRPNSPIPDPGAAGVGDVYYVGEAGNQEWPSCEWGRAVEYGRVLYRIVAGVPLYADVAVDENDVRTFLVADAGAHLPPGTRFEVRVASRRRRKNPLPGAGTSGMAWYRASEMDEVADWGAKPEQHVTPVPAVP